MLQRRYAADKKADLALGEIPKDDKNDKNNWRRQITQITPLVAKQLAYNGGLGFNYFWRKGYDKEAPEMAHMQVRRYGQ